MADTLGDLIRAAREAAGMRQSDAAQAAGMDRKRWHEIECGRVARPDDRTVAKMLEAIGVVRGSLVWNRAQDLYAPALAAPAHPVTAAGAA